MAKVPNAKILWVAHREELIGQAYDQLESFGLSCGIISANPPRMNSYNPFRKVQVASIQTLMARDQVVDGVTMLIYDEFHHSCSSTWSKLPNQYKSQGALIIGATATPIRGDGIGLGEVVDSLVIGLTTKQAIEQNYLCPFEIIRPPTTLRPDEIAQSPVDAYKMHSNGEKAIIFAAHIKAAEKFLEEFTDAGIPSVLITGKTPREERRAKLRDYKTGKVRVFINCNVAVEGFDDPSTSCIILACPVGFIGRYLQILGRGLRPSPNKTKLTITDLHGSSWIHEPPDAAFHWSLEGEALKKPKLVNLQRFCVGCGVLLEPDQAVCDLCLVARPELVPPTVVNIRLQKYASKIRENPQKRAEYLAKLMMIAYTKNHKYGSVFWKYRAIYGEPASAEITNMARAIIKEKRKQSNEQ